MTKGEALEGALRWIDEATVGGNAADHDEVADLKDRMAVLLDGVLQFLGTQFTLYGEKKIVQQPMPVLFGKRESRLILPGEVFAMRAEGAGSFYLEVSGRAEIVLNGKATIYCGTESGFSVYRGNLPPVDGEAVVTVKSEVPFFVRNAALYAARFAEDTEVPVYAPFVPYTMPENFRELEKIVRVDGGLREEWREFRKQGDRTFLLPYGVTGEFQFCYFRQPERISAGAANDAVLDCHPMAEVLVPLKLAVDVTAGMEEKAELSSYLESKFLGTLRNMLPEPLCECMRVETVYGGYGWL